VGDRASAERWDKHCGACAYRNGFILPTLRDFIGRRTPGSILDVGAASGYIARNTASAHLRARWTLLDADANRIDLAKELCPGDFSFVVGNVFEAQLPSFDLVLLSNTLLEFELSSEKLARLTRLVNPEGWLVAVVPDTSADVVQEARAGNDLFDEYALGNLQLNKRGKYPFVAHRSIDVVCAFVDQGLALSEARRNPMDGAFFFAFSAGGSR
jgi:SAM-dependent methyltransferase